MFGGEQVLDELDAMVDKVAATEDELDVARLRALIERLEHAWLERVRAAELRGDWQAEGFVSTAAWLRERCRMTHGAAASAIDLARRLEQLPATSEAFASGAISRAHAHVIARAATPERAEAIREVEASLVLAATHTGPKQLRDLTQYVTDAIDGDGGARAAEARDEQQRLHVSPLLNGLYAIDGLVDAEAGEWLLSTLECAMQRARTAGDPRSAARLRIDALVELCRAGAHEHAKGPGRRHRPHVSVVVDLELLDGQTGNGRDSRVPRCDAEHAGRIPAATLERLLCDCGISRIPTNLDNCELRCPRHHRAVHEGAHSPPNYGKLAA